METAGGRGRRHAHRCCARCASWPASTTRPSSSGSRSRAASPPPGAGVLAEGLPQADRSRRRRTGRGRSRRRARAQRAGRDRAANCDRRRRHRGPDDGAHAARPRNRVDGLRSPSVADRRPHALRLRRLSRLLGQRPGSRVVRRADRHGPQDDPRARQAVQPRDRRPARRRAERLDDTYRFFGHYYPDDEADSDFKAIHEALHRDVRGELSDDLQDLDAPRGSRSTT